MKDNNVEINKNNTTSIITSSIIPTILVFILNLFFSALLSYLTSTKGNVETGETINLGTTNYSVVEIYNGYDYIINDLLISIPDSALVNNIITSKPIKIEEKNFIKSNNSKVISFSGFTSEESCLILLPVSNNSNLIKILNYKDLKLALNKKNYIKPFYTYLIEALPSVILVTLIMWIGVLNFERKNIKALKELYGIKNKSEQDYMHIKDELHEAKKKMNSTMFRYRVFLVAKLQDYKKELEFWKKCFQSFIVNNKSDLKYSQKYLDEITKTLKTYNTKENVDEELSEAIEYFNKQFDKQDKISEINNKKT